MIVLNGCVKTMVNAPSSMSVTTGVAWENFCRTMFAIMCTSAVTIGAKGSVEIGSAEQAAQALEPVAGSFAKAGSFTLERRIRP